MPEKYGCVDPQTAADTETALWAWLRGRYYKDKDLSAALDILRQYSANGVMLPVHVEAAQAIMKGKPLDATLVAEEPPKETTASDPAKILRSLADGGLLRGRNGMKAVSLLEQSHHWTAAQAKYAADLAHMIRRSALLFVSLREMAEAGDGGRFAESLVESFDDWGSYTESQIEKARGMVMDRTGKDPLEPLDKRQMDMFKKDRPQVPGIPDPPADDDIPF